MCLVHNATLTSGVCLTLTLTLGFVSMLTLLKWALRVAWHSACILVRECDEVRWGYFTTDGQSVCLGIEHPCGTCDQILLPVWMLLYEIWGLVSVRRPLWREDRSATCSVITKWSESLKTRNHTLLSHLRLPQPGEPGSRIYIPQEQGGPVIPRMWRHLVTPGRMAFTLSF
jgi:hypothetical protein